MKLKSKQFEFNRWKEAFQYWEEQYKLYGDKLQFVISVGTYTSGYWIEPISGRDVLDGNDYIYQTKEEVDALFQRVKTEIETAERESRGIHFIK